ncbi:MAG: MarC family protein [Desulfosalsimonadaceae bacterium]
MFQHEYSHDPLVVPIAMPSIAGPSAVMTLIILKTDKTVATLSILEALAAVFAAAFLLLYCGRMLMERLGSRVLRALEKFMGMLLSLLAVDMMMEGIRSVLQTLP